MKLAFRALLLATLAVSSLAPVRATPAGDETHYPFLVGRAKADITGPAPGVPLWGFGRPDQLDEGLHFRQWARAFVIVDRESGHRLAFVSADIGSITHTLFLEVLSRLEHRFGDTYTRANLLISATHTHAAPGGFWHAGAGTPLGSAFHQEIFDAIAAGITDAIAQAHDDLQPGAVLLDSGELQGAGAQRSAVAYLANPAAERARYAHDTDRQMTVLVLATASGPIGMISWFAVHPTAMTFDNRLISGDHKGHASALFEQQQGPGFVAAFAQSNCGDVTANLNLDNTGPAGDDDIENTRILAERQVAKARELMAGATERLHGPIDSRQSTVDFSRLEVADAFTHAGTQHTCPSAYGYAFGAGSTEDGGGHPLLHEGMLEQDPTIDQMAQALLKLPPPSEELKACHSPKPILIASGETKPHPAQAQILPLGVARIGRLALVVVPAEITTMAGRRLRETVLERLGDEVELAVIVGYTNDYAGYVTTHEEYLTQQYEGGHTLYGPWTLAGYRQELARIAADLAAGRATRPGPSPRDPRGDVTSLPLATGDDVLPPGAHFGDLVAAPDDAYEPGNTVTLAFRTGNPRNAYRTGTNTLRVERRVRLAGDDWIVAATDDSWSTQVRWLDDLEHPGALRFEARWTIPSDATLGEYRFVHRGVLQQNGRVEDRTVTSPVFLVQAGQP